MKKNGHKHICDNIFIIYIIDSVYSERKKTKNKEEEQKNIKIKKIS